MKTELKPLGNDSLSSPRSVSEIEAAAALPIAAERPDAAPEPGDDALRLAFHVLTLVAVVALLAYCVIWAPSHRPTPDAASTASSGSRSTIAFNAAGGA